MRKNVNGVKKLRAVDFFCGAGGMSYGLKRAGIKVLAGIDFDVECQKTYETNIKESQYVLQDLTKLTCPALQRRLNINRNDDYLIFAGCSPCQYWSKMNTDRTKSQKSAFLLKVFQKFIRYFRPGFVIVENVPGLLNKKHESILPSFLSFLKNHDYAIDDGIINCNQFGVPQNRFRYVLVATRLHNEITLPKGKTNPSLIVRHYIGVANGFKAIKAGTRDKTVFLHSSAALSSKNLKRISITKKNGGTRSIWQNDAELIIPAYKGKGKLFPDVYGRMFWDKPAPTITTKFHSFTNGRFGHPEEDRAISLREGATLQTFPKKYRFTGSTQASLARQIGNAVPPALATKMGRYLVSLAK